MFTFHIHIKNHVDIEKLLSKSDFIIRKIITMSELGQEIKALLLAATGKVDNIAADVARLNKKIEELSLNPTPAEIQDIKTLSAEINAKLQVVDDAGGSEEEPPPPPPEGTAREIKGKTMNG